MADRLTQLQNAIDQVATQFFSALRYVGTHHDAIPVGSEAKVTDDNAVVDEPETFEAAMNELARDLIVKSKQIEVLITSLPGLGVTEEDQHNRLRLLEVQMREAEEERQRSIEDKNKARERLEAVVVGLRRV